MEIGGLSDCNYCWHAGGGQDRGGSTGGRRRGGPGRSPGRVQRRSAGAAQGRSPNGAGASGLSRNELKMFHEQIMSRNEACFVKMRNQIFSPPGFRRQQSVADDSVRLCA